MAMSGPTDNNVDRIYTINLQVVIDGPIAIEKVLNAIKTYDNSLLKLTKCFQQVNRNKFRWSVDTKQRVDEIITNLEIKPLKVEGYRTIITAARHSKTIVLYETPYEYPDYKIKELMGQFGKISQINRGYLRDFPDILDGRVFVQYAIQQGEIPDVLPLGNSGKILIRQQGKQPRANRCYKCGEEGANHLAAECPNNTTCFKCREEGHLARDCPQKKSRSKYTQLVNDINDIENGTDKAPDNTPIAVNSNIISTPISNKPVTPITQIPDVSQIMKDIADMALPDSQQGQHLPLSQDTSESKDSGPDSRHRSLNNSATEEENNPEIQYNLNFPRLTDEECQGLTPNDDLIPPGQLAEHPSFEPPTVDQSQMLIEFEEEEERRKRQRSENDTSNSGQTIHSDISISRSISPNTRPPSPFQLRNEDERAPKMTTLHKHNNKPKKKKKKSSF